MTSASAAGPQPYVRSSEVMARLRSTANKQRFDTLTRLEAACDALDRAGDDLTFANIGRHCEATLRKGPRAQSIKSDPGMKEYVVVRRDERLVAAEADQLKGRKPRNAAAVQINRIPDAGLRARMRTVHAESLDARKRLADIQSAILAMTPGLDVDTLIRRHAANPSGPVSMQPARPNQEHAPEDIEALRCLLVVFDDPDKLASLTLANDGRRIKRSRGVAEELVSPKVLSGLRRLYISLADRPQPPTIDVYPEADGLD